MNTLWKKRLAVSPQWITDKWAGGRPWNQQGSETFQIKIKKHRIIRKYKEEDEWGERTGLSFWLSQRLRHLSLAADYTTTTTTTQEWIPAGGDVVVMKNNDGDGKSIASKENEHHRLIFWKHRSLKLMLWKYMKPPYFLFSFKNIKDCNFNEFIQG